MTDIVERLRNPLIVIRAMALRIEAADEIERLAAALQMIIDDTYDDWAKNVARRALEPKP